jgi:hypothetical protein
MAKGLTRNITKKQASAYRRTIPNKRGVTALAEINGPGAYDKRNPKKGGSSMSYTPRQKAAMKRMTPKRRAAFKKMLDRSPDIRSVRASSTKKGGRRKTARRAYESNGTHEGAVRKTARDAYDPNKPTDYRPFGAAQLLWGSGKMKKADYVAMMVARGHSKKQADSYWKRKGLKPGQKRKPRKRRTYGKGTIKPLRASYGGKSRYTYKYKTKKGHVRDIPDWALLGYRSSREMREVLKGEDEAARGRLGARRQKLEARRVKAADRTQRRILAGKGVFAPNEGTVLSFEEWKNMRTNAPRKRRKKTTTRRKRVAGGFDAFKRRMKKKHGAKTSLKQIRAWYKFATQGAKGSRKPKARRAASRATKGRRRKKTTARRRKTTTRRKKTTTRRRKATTRRRSSRAKSMTITMRANRRGTRKGQRRRTARRAYRRNVPQEQWKGEMVKALKLGLLVTGGFMAHRALCKLLDEYGLSKIDALTKPKGTAEEQKKMTTLRGILSGAIVAAVAIPVTTRVLPAEATAVSAGIAASFIHGAIIAALKSSESTEKAVAYLGNYPNAEGSNLPNYLQGTGSYYEFTPHEIFPATNGVGEYYELPVAGMGEYYELPVAGMGGYGEAPLRLNQLTQAAAGYGQPQGNPLVTQAAAGMGMQPLHLNQLTQAAAGYGNNSMDGSPLVTQAAAGTGQFMAYGVEGVGEYDEVGTRSQPMTMDEGVHPNLHSAEQALSVAEAAAGVGSLDVPLQSTVNPTVIADPLDELPGGSRSGVFQGGDGIFG